MLEKYISFIKSHEKLVLIIGILAVVLFLGNKYINYADTVAKAQAIVAQNTLTQQTNENKALAVQISQMQSQYQAIIDSVTRQNAALAQTISSRDQGLKTQVNANNSMSTVELAARWRSLAEVPDSDMQISNSGVTVSPNGARQTVNQLEQVPVLQADIKDQKSISDNKDIEINKANDIIGQYKVQVVGLNKQITDEQISCKAQVKAIKDDGIKGRRNWFIAGFIAGIGTRILAKF